MKNKLIIRSGIDPSSEEFKKYLYELDKNNVACAQLKILLDTKENKIATPLIFKDSDYNDYCIEDIAFLIMNNEIIGHKITKIEKLRKVKVLHVNSIFFNEKNNPESHGVRRSFGTIEYVTLFKINADSNIYQYYCDRLDGKVESIGELKIEQKKK